MVEHNRVRHGRDAYDFTRKRDGKRLGSRAQEPGVDRRSGRALQLCGDLFDSPSANIRGVDADDFVTDADAGTFCRRAGEDLFNGDEPFLAHNGHPDATVEPAGVLVEHVEILRRVELRVRILQFGDQATCGLLIESPDRERVYETVVDDGDHLLKQPHAALRRSFLNDEAADDDRCDEGGGEEEFLGAGRVHGSIREKGSIDIPRRRIPSEYARRKASVPALFLPTAPDGMWHANSMWPNALRVS